VREFTWIWTIGAPLVRAVMRIVFRLRVEGIEHVPASGPTVLAPNHVSVLDGPTVSALVGAGRHRVVRNLVAAEAFHGPIGWILEQARQIPIRRGSGDMTALAKAVDAVATGGCVGIFAEGRVGEEPADGLQRLRSGLTRIAIPTTASVVPVGIWGLQTLWPRSGLRRQALVRRPKVVFVFGAPIVPGPAEAPSAFRERFRCALVEQVARARWLAGDPA
jgi:1-acyl-sn-glycerol-3-phosphate acyltransferase